MPGFISMVCVEVLQVRLFANRIDRRLDLHEGAPVRWLRVSYSAAQVAMASRCQRSLC